MGKLDRDMWRGDDSQQITFVVTQDCNLRCKYCYMTDKNDKNIMDFETAKRAIDYFVDNKEDLFSTEYIVLDFIGGEPLLEINLIDQIVDYFILSTYQKKSKWFGRFRIMVQSNGVLFNTPEVQQFLEKNKSIVSLGITIDGTKRKHDMQRVFPNGADSYDIVEENYKLAFQKNYTNTTKVTFGSDDLKYMKESIVHLWDMGIINVPANIVYEDIWKEGDEKIYFEQLIELADYIIDNHLWDRYNTSLFSDSIGFKTAKEDLTLPTCGTGNMYCVDSNGDIYNCVRFMQYSLNHKNSRKIGDIYKGIDTDRIRPLKVINPKHISNQQCLDCKINSGCTSCAGNNYDLSENDSLFYRSTAICNMYKVQVKANNYYWARLFNEHSVCRDTEFRNQYFMYFILSSDSVNYCKFKVCNTEEIMKPEDLLYGLEYAFDNFYQPVFVHSNGSMEWLNDLLRSDKYGISLSKQMNRHIIRHITKYQGKNLQQNTIYVVDNTTCKPKEELNGCVIFNIASSEIKNLAQGVKEVLQFTSRVNINVYDINKHFDISEYENQLKLLCDVLYDYLCKGKQKEIRQLTDRIFAREMNNCFAGEKNITFAPDGKFYICPAFYFDKAADVNINKVQSMTYLYNSPGCQNCDAYHCDRCVYKNYIGTGELNIPTIKQCELSYLERKYSMLLLERLKEGKITGFKNVEIPKVEYSDPVENLIQNPELAEYFITNERRFNYGKKI